ncbi:lipopolysaccharide biosynthesis protein [Metabacillus idriensis]|uniref:lipopolysaccharide biosynthesis protein n=1 Tax=Metabacillus idriensis TaxID=324768 RepID=UPI003D2D639D
MRVKNSLINISAGLGNQVIITLLSFVSRTVFIYSLGIEYLGLNGLLTNVLGMLTLVEAGFGASIMYSLYKPVSDNDHKKISALMNLYKRVYLVIAFVVLALGLLLLPFLSFIIKDTKIENVTLIYLIFLLNTVLPYLYVHKSSFLNVCQKNYIVTGFYTVSAIISTLLKIFILHYTQNYLLFLAIESVITLVTSVSLAMVVNRMYPFLKSKSSQKIDKDTKDHIIKNVKAIILQNIGVFLIFGTDNIIISSFVSVAAVGLYSNYHMLIEIFRTFTYQIFNNLYHSIGNLVANESKEKVYQIFKVIMFLNFWLYSLFSIVIFILIEPFISLWIGSDYLLGNGVLIVLIILFYERGMRNSITTVKTTAGIFHEDRFAPLIQAFINLFFSILLVKQLGLIGVFIGTLISTVLVPFWTTPYFVCKRFFKISIWVYYKSYTYYTLIAIAACLLTYILSSFIQADTFLMLILKGIVCFTVPNGFYILLFRKTDEYIYLANILTGLLNNISKKIKGNLKNSQISR